MRQGFSLLELSIVLVIIGLIAGGIVAGASMIRAAELRAVITDYQQYQTAVYTFKDKYLGLPGDLKNATAFWGAAHATHANCIALDHTSPSVGSETCNGDGDGQIGTTNTPTDLYERFRFWQQLANADLIPGTYTGVQGSDGGNDADVGENVPESKISGAGFSMRYSDNTGVAFPHMFSLTVTVFGAEAAGNGISAGDVLTPEEAWSIDKKLDDGKSGYGFVTAYRGGGTSDCHTNVDPALSEYSLATGTIECALVFKY